MAIQPKNTTDIKVDKISEKTAAAGVRIDDQLTCDEAITLTTGDITFSEAGRGIIEAVDATFAATGTTQAAAAAITKKITMVTSATGSSADSVLLPDATIGGKWTIINESGATINVFPGTGLNIDDGAANAATTIANNARANFVRMTSTRWIKL